MKKKKKGEIEQKKKKSRERGRELNDEYFLKEKLKQPT